MRTILAIVAVLAAVAPAAPTSTASSNESIGDLKELAVDAVWWNVRAQYGRLWARLYPTLKRHVTRERWEECKRREARETAGVKWRSVKITDIYADSVRLPGIGRRRVQAVRLEAKVSYSGQDTEVRDTVYFVSLRGRWYGTWTREQFNAYRAGRCPK